jgi:3-deoxy-D-manno-octulosonic-acid transferase
LENALVELLSNPARREQLGENALQVVRENMGAMDRTVDMIINGIKDRGLYVTPSRLQPATVS